VYQDEKNFFPQFAIDADTYRTIYTEFLVPADDWRAFLADKQGAIVGKATADRFGWKVGQRIPIKGAIFPGDWEFNLHGIYTGRRPNDDLTQFWFRWDYLRERAPPWAADFVGWYTVRIAPGADGVQVAKAIDQAFANSAWESRTQTESAFMQSFVEQMGNIEFLMVAIGSIVFFTLLLVTGNTMATSVRERTGELAVLKTVGFTDRAVLVLVLVESLLIAGLGGGLGIGLAKAFTLAGDPTHGMLASFYLPPAGIAAGATLSLAVGLLAGLLPAWSARRLEVVEALRRL
jgi:putative ABC transport system permease protein